MKILKALKFGYAVLKIVEQAGVSVKGVPIETIDRIAAEAVQKVRAAKDAPKT